MKKILYIFLCFSLILSICSCEHKTIIDDTETDKTLSTVLYEYGVQDNSIIILSHNDLASSIIVVPETIEDHPVMTLGKDAFYNHKNTVSITLPQNLKTIEGSPFYRCYSLKNIVIPQNVESINCNPFFRCISLENIIVDKKNLYFSDLNGVLFNKEKTILISYPEGKQGIDYIIPETVEKLAVDCFGYHTKIKNLTIKSNVKEMPDGNMFVFPNDITLIVEKNSVAEKYAQKHKLNYKLL